jgi:hypothetical protein
MQTREGTPELSSPETWGSCGQPPAPFVLLPHRALPRAICHSLDSIAAMKIKWILTHEAVAEASPGPDFTAFDGEKTIGRVYQVEHGPDRGVWCWAMTADQPGPTSAFATSGRAAERAKAGRCVIQAYRRLLAHPPPATVAKGRLSALKQARG